MGLTLTYAAGNGIAAVVGEAQSFGVAYGADGSYGCFTTLCYGLVTDVAISAFVSMGFYDEYSSVNGFGFASFQEVQVPGNLVSFSTSQVFSRDDAADLTPGAFVGTEDAFGIGAGLNPWPVGGGVFLCETVLDTLIDGSSGGPIGLPPPRPPRAGNTLANGDFDDDLESWHCDNQEICEWLEDDPFAATNSGAGAVSSPIETPANPGRLESSCLSATPGETLVAEAWLRATGAEDGLLLARWFSTGDCSGGAIRTAVIAEPEPDGNWQRWSEELVVPANIYSLQLSAEAFRDELSGESSMLRIDSVYVPEPPGAVAALAAMATLAGLARRRVRRVSQVRGRVRPLSQAWVRLP